MIQPQRLMGNSILNEFYGRCTYYVTNNWRSSLQWRQCQCYFWLKVKCFFSSLIQTPQYPSIVKIFVRHQVIYIFRRFFEIGIYTFTDGSSSKTLQHWLHKNRYLTWEWFSRSPLSLHTYIHMYNRDIKGFGPLFARGLEYQNSKCIFNIQNAGFFWIKSVVKFSLWVFHKSIYKRNWVLLIEIWMFWYHCKFDFQRFCFHSTNQVWRAKSSCADRLSLQF